MLFAAMTASDYIQSRGLPPSIVPEWGLGDPSPRQRYSMLDNRLIIPIMGYSGQRVATAGRALDDSQPKYWNTSFAKERWLYGLWKHCDGLPVLVEGFFDVWALRLLGYRAYAVMSASLSDWQAAHILSMGNKCIVYPHEDQTGQQWCAKLRGYGVRASSPPEPYPRGAPPKSDPHWLYTHDRDWLVRMLYVCEQCLKPRSALDTMLGRLMRNGHISRR